MIKVEIYEILKKLPRNRGKYNKCFDIYYKIIDRSLNKFSLLFGNSHPKFFECQSLVFYEFY